MVVIGNGFAKFFFAANKADGGAASTVFDFNMMDAFIADFRTQVSEITKEIEEKIKNNGTLDIGTDGDNARIMAIADRYWDTLEGNRHELNANSKQFYSDMVKVFETMGWKRPSERPDKNPTFIIPASNLKKPIEVMIDGKPRKLTALQAYLSLNGMTTGLDKFNKTEAARKVADAKRKGQSLMYFMT